MRVLRRLPVGSRVVIIAANAKFCGMVGIVAHRAKHPSKGRVLAVRIGKHGMYFYKRSYLRPTEVTNTYDKDDVVDSTVHLRGADGELLAFK